ncbi:MAG TPA: hypothetical protein VGH76_13960 [Actinomycetospora sp.]|uniref:hypothetical protein n=1 Tax=Actinomycetospora sp. TaxID=1872135 RepID=UPI002F42BFD2
MSAHRRVRPPRPAVTGGAVLAGAALLGLGVGPTVGHASAAPTSHVEAAPETSVLPAAEGSAHDALWYGLLTTAAVAGAAGAQLTRGRPRRA